MRAYFWLPVWMILASSCGPANFADVKCEGEAQTKKLTEELRKIETKEELQKSLGCIKKRFDKIAELLLIARSVPKETLEPSIASEQLFMELARLYEIPGCQELIESAQMDAVRRLQ